MNKIIKEYQYVIKQGSSKNIGTYGGDTTKSSSKEGGSDSSGKTKVETPNSLITTNATFGDLVTNN